MNNARYARSGYPNRAGYSSGAPYGTKNAGTYRCGTDCGCDTVLPVMAYVPVQSWGETFPELLALKKGTLFVALDKPFYGKGGCACG